MSWEQLCSIVAERTEIKRIAGATPPAACPNDGEPLIGTGNGSGLYCPFDGWRWPDGNSTAIR